MNPQQTEDEGGELFAPLLEQLPAEKLERVDHLEVYRVQRDDAGQETRRLLTVGGESRFSPWETDLAAIVQLWGGGDYYVQAKDGRRRFVAGTYHSVEGLARSRAAISCLPSLDSLRRDSAPIKKHQGMMLREPSRARSRVFRLKPSETVPAVGALCACLTACAPTPASHVLLTDYGQRYPLQTGQSTDYACPSEPTRHASIVTLRGWLTPLEEQHTDPNAADFDIHAAFTPDWAWLREHRIPLEQVLRVGNMFTSAVERPDAAMIMYGEPSIVVEIAGWRIAPNATNTNMTVCTANAPPRGWVHSGINPDILWPFQLPTHDATTYAEVRGALIVDSSHCWRDRSQAPDPEVCAKEAWSRRPCAGETPPDDQSRWTELHPPDAIQFLSYPPTRSETVQFVAVAARTEARDFEVALRAPGPRPDGMWAHIYESHVLINEADWYSAVTFDDHVVVRGRVSGTPLIQCYQSRRFLGWFRIGWYPCRQDSSLCNGTCVDRHSDPANCGSCGHRCRDGMNCANGRCVEVDSGCTPEAPVLCCRVGEHYYCGTRNPETNEDNCRHISACIEPRP